MHIFFNSERNKAFQAIDNFIDWNLKKLLDQSEFISVLSWIYRRLLIAFLVTSSVIRQKGESQNGCFKKTKHAKFSAKTNIFYPLIRTRTCAYAYQGIKNVHFCGKFGVLCFLETPGLRFALLPYYRRLILRKTARAGLLNRKSDFLKRRRENTWIDNTHSVFPVNLSGVSYGLITGIIVFKISINDIIEWINDLKLVNIKDGHSGKKY